MSDEDNPWQYHRTWNGVRVLIRRHHYMGYEYLVNGQVYSHESKAKRACGL